MDVTCTVSTPVHIGTGDQRYGVEYIETRGRALYPDLDGYFSEHPEEIDAFVEDMGQGRSADAYFDSAVDALYSLESWASPGTIGERPVQTALKDGHGEPYIPGSTLKGAIRTALAHHALTDGGARLESVDGQAVESLFRLGDGGFQADIGRAITIRDASVVNDRGPPLALARCKTHSLQHSGDMDPKFWDTYLEVLTPGTTLQTEISIDDRLLRRMLDEYGGDDRIDVLFDGHRSESAILDEIGAAIASTAESIETADRDLTGSFEAVETSYEALGSTGLPLRIGFGSGWHGTTVGTAFDEIDRRLMRADNRLGKPHRHEGCEGILVPDDHTPGALFCTECYEGGIDPESDDARVTPFPKTRRFVYREGSPAAPLGWIELDGLDQGPS